MKSVPHVRYAPVGPLPAATPLLPPRFKPVTASCPLLVMSRGPRNRLGEGAQSEMQTDGEETGARVSGAGGIIESWVEDGDDDEHHEVARGAEGCCGQLRPLHH
jgi:hypothetical protein